MYMMKICLILIFCFISVSVDAWVSIAQSDPNTEHLGDCYTTHYNLGAMTRGEERRIEGKCAKASCGMDRYIRIKGCGVFQVGPPCKVVDGDLSKPYPKCCYEIECPEPTPKLVQDGGQIPKNDIEKAEMENGGVRNDYRESVERDNKL